MSDCDTLHIQDPWTLVYSEYEGELVKVLRERIGPKHPLYNRDAYAVAVRRDPDAILYETVDDGTYAIVYLKGTRGRRRGMPKTELFADRRALAQRIAADHAERLEQYKRWREE